MSNFKKAASIVMAGAIVSGGIGQYSVSADDASIDVERISGDDRFETSIEIAKKLNRKKAYFVSGDNPWDALSVGPVASNEKASIILASRKDRVKNDIKVLDIETATIVGGKNSISDDISDIIERTIKTKKISGRDRYETSELLVESMKSKDVGLAGGSVFADALSSGAFLSQKNMPLLLLNNKNEIKDGFNPIYTFGGAKSISKTFGKRIAGANRYETAEKIAAEYKNFDTVILASGKNFADALSATPLAHQLNAPILLSDGKTLTKGSKEIIKKTKKVVVVGGRASISQSLLEEIKNINKKDSSVSSSSGSSSSGSSSGSSSSSSGDKEVKEDSRLYARLVIDFDKDGLVEEELSIALKEGERLDGLVKEMQSSTSFLENTSPKGYTLKGWKIRGKNEIKTLEEIKELKASKDLLSTEEGEEKSIYIEAIFEKDSKDPEKPIEKEDKDKTPEDDKDKDSTGKDDSGKPTDKDDKEEDDISLNPQVEIKDPPFLSTNLTINTSNKSTMDWFKFLNEQKANFKLNGKDIEISKADSPYSKEKSFYIRNVDDGTFSFSGFEDGDIITISIMDKANKQKWPDVNIKYSIGGFGATFKVVK